MHHRQPFELGDDQVAKALAKNPKLEDIFKNEVLLIKLGGKGQKDGLDKVLRKQLLDDLNQSAGLVDAWEVLYKVDANHVVRKGKNGELSYVKKYLDNTKQHVDDVMDDINRSNGYENWKKTWDRVSSGTIFRYSEINKSNFHLYFKEITLLREASECTSNCTVVSISLAKKLNGKKILGSDKFSKAFVGDGENGTGILDNYVDLVPSHRKPPKPFVNPFPTRSLLDKKYTGNFNNKNLLEGLFHQIPNNTALIFASYKGLNKSRFTGHAFNVIKDENGVIKFLDVQSRESLEYGEGMEALLNKMRKHSLENYLIEPPEVSSWHFYNASTFKK